MSIVALVFLREQGRNRAVASADLSSTLVFEACCGIRLIRSAHVFFLGEVHLHCHLHVLWVW